MIIKGSNGNDIIIDKDDYEKLKDIKWSVRINKRHDHSKERVSIRNTKVGMSIGRFILNCPKDKIVDHINGNAFDNRKCNLRICTYSQNNANRRLDRNKKQYRGVYKKRSHYEAGITINKKFIYLGCSKDPKACAKMYNDAASKQYGEFAVLNKID